MRRRRGGKDGSLEIKISKDMKDILQKGPVLQPSFQRSFDITIDPVSSLWDFSSGKGTVPDAAR